jgi:PadR family transcriptional regulator PadR
MTESWPPQWTRGVLELAVLGAVGTDRAYGYLIAQRIAESGLGTVKGGTLYPLLQRLEQEGVVTSQWEAGERGPGRKYFTLTASGIARLHEQREQWLHFTASVGNLIENRTATP